MQVNIDPSKWYCVQYIIFSFIGAFVLYFKMIGSGKPVLTILFKINPKLSNNAWFILVESILVSLIGAVLAIAITQPTSIPQAIVSGLGWTGIINGSVKNTED